MEPLEWKLGPPFTPRTRRRQGRPKRSAGQRRGERIRCRRPRRASQHHAAIVTLRDLAHQAQPRPTPPACSAWQTDGRRTRRCARGRPRARPGHVAHAQLGFGGNACIPPHLAAAVAACVLHRLRRARAAKRLVALHLQRRPVDSASIRAPLPRRSGRAGRRARADRQLHWPAGQAPPRPARRVQPRLVSISRLSRPWARSAGYPTCPAWTGHLHARGDSAVHWRWRAATIRLHPAPRRARHGVVQTGRDGNHLVAPVTSTRWSSWPAPKRPTPFLSDSAGA